MLIEKKRRTYSRGACEVELIIEHHSSLVNKGSKELDTTAVVQHDCSFGSSIRFPKLQGYKYDSVFFTPGGVAVVKYNSPL